MLQEIHDKIWLAAIGRESALLPLPFIFLKAMGIGLNDALDLTYNAQTGQLIIQLDPEELDRRYFEEGLI